MSGRPTGLSPGRRAIGMGDFMEKRRDCVLDVGERPAAPAFLLLSLQHLFAMFGIPVSTSLAVVGAVVGVGQTKGAAAVSARKVAGIFAGWVLTPVCAAGFAVLVFRLLEATLF